jgi:nicotinate-nucleotide adenylyltransferase
VQLAVEGEKKLRAVDIEFKLPKPSYTINTLAYLEEKYPDYSFALIMGSDSFQNISGWKNYQQILKRYPIYVYLRPGNGELPQFSGANIIVIKAPLLEISATQIRNNIKQAKSIRYLVPENVREEIERNGYYKTA